MYVNGKPRPIGYLSDLRLLEQYRNVGLVARGYKYLRDLHTDGRAHLYLTTIAEGNDRAISILASSRAGLPIYQFTGSYHTVAIPLTRRPGRHVRDTSAIEVRPATDSDLGALLQFFEQVGPTRQFFPKYEAQDFSNSHGTFRGLRFSDLLLAFRGGRLVGTLGGWDQHRFRQTVVEGYHSHLRWTRSIYNCWARVRGRPKLPRPGQPFRYLTGALLTVEDNDLKVLQVLLETLLAQTVESPSDYLLIGLHETDALLPFVIKRSVTSYVTRLYHVCWKDGEDLRRRLDRRPPYLELGCL